MGRECASKSASGGAANEAGSAYRAALAAVISAHALRGLDIPALELPIGRAVPEVIGLESDQPVDDIEVGLVEGGKAWIQAKRALQLSARAESPLAKAIEQCRRHVEESEPNPDSNRLVIATGSASGPILDLASALRRRRDSHAYSPSQAERAAMDRLEPLLTGLEPSARNRLLDCLVIWVCDVEERTSDGAERGALLLDGQIVQHGFGERAFVVLCGEARVLARNRAGADLDRLLAALRAGDVPLIEDAEGAAAARLLARQQAAARYRRRLQHDGETIRLLGVGAGLPELELSDVDAKVRATEPKLDEDRPSERDLGLLIRRRQHLTLTGLPGGGKSTALRKAAAQQAADPTAPLPVVIRLDRLAKRLGTRGFGDILLDLATEEAPNADRPLLREHLAERIDRGEATLFLDSLDESRNRKREVVEAIPVYLDGVGDELEVVVATRDSALIEAQSLDFREARLSEPGDLDQPVGAILRAFAKKSGVADVAAWVRIRKEWVDGVLSRDRDLTKTPLMPILLAVSAASHEDHATLPQLRAEILRGVVEDVVTEWEKTRAEDGDLELGKLRGEQAGTALLDSFLLEGSLLAERPDIGEKEVEKALAGALIEKWGLPPGDARATALEAISFWDDAGFFMHAGGGELSPRVKLFSELGDALSHVALEQEEVREWVSQAIGDPDREEALKLAAGLSPVAARELVDAAAEDGGSRPVFLAVQAIEEGGEISAARQQALIRALLGVMADGGNPAAEAAGHLAAMRIPNPLQAEVLESFDRDLPEAHALVARVRATIHWELEQGPEAHMLFRKVLRIKEPEPIEPPKKGVADLFLFRTDSRWSDAVAGAAEALEPLAEADAEAVAARIEKVGHGSSVRLVAVLERSGHEDLALETQKRAARSLARANDLAERFRDSDEADAEFLEMVTSLGEPRELTTRERRGLDELVDLFFTMGIPHSESFDFSEMVLKQPAAIRSLLEAVLELGGFNRSLLASEAALFRRETDSDLDSSPSMMVYIPGIDRGLTRWEDAQDPEQTVDGLVGLIRFCRFSAHVAASGLEFAPPDLEANRRLREKLAQRKRWAQELAGLVVLQTDGSLEKVQEDAGHWLEDGPPPLRRTAALFAAATAKTSARSRELLLQALRDRDRGVRGEAIRGLKPDDLTPELQEAVEQAAEGTGDWECRWCGAPNPANRDSCENCNSNPPELKRLIKELLRS